MELWQYRDGVQDVLQTWQEVIGAFCTQDVIAMVVGCDDADHSAQEMQRDARVKPIATVVDDDNSASSREKPTWTVGRFDPR